MAVSPWFDYNAYMANKLTQLKATDAAGNWDAFKVADAFIKSGFAGPEGAERHFMQFGQTEDVAPNAFFNAMEYYYAKAAQVKGIDVKAVTAEDAAMVKNAIADLGMNAWSHYKTFGSEEKVNPSNGFDTEKYMNAKLEALNASLADGQTKYKIEDVYAAFKAQGISALEHFMTFGGDASKGEVAFKYDGSIPEAFAVDDVKKVHPAGGGSGETQSFTLGLDNLIGTAGDDLFVARSDSGVATLQNGDKVNGGAGTDTLRIFGADAGAFALNDVAITSVEKIEVMGALGNVTGNSFAPNKIAGVKEFWLTSATATTAALNVSVGSGQALGISGSFNGNNGATALTATYADTTDAKLMLNNAVFTDGATDGITAAGVSKLTISAAGANTLGTLTVADLDTLVFTGEGSVKTAKTAAIDAKNTGLKLVDASALKGGVDLTLTTGDLSTTDTAKTVIKGGAGNDSIAFTADTTNAMLDVDLGDGDNTFLLHTAIGAKSTVKAGAGTNDKLVLNNTTTKLDGTTGKIFTGFETVVLDGTGITYEHGSVKGIQNILVQEGGSEAYVLKSIGDIDVQVGAKGDTTVIASLTANSGVTKGELNLTLNNEADAAAAGVVITSLVTDDATLNINSIGMANSTHNKITGAATSTGIKDIAITGNQAIDLVLDDASVNIKTVDASALAVKKGAAGLDLTLGNMASNQTGIVVTGSVGNDTFTVNGSGGDDEYAFNFTTGGTDAVVFASAAANDKMTVVHDGKTLAALGGSNMNVAGAAGGATAVVSGGAVVVDFTADIAALLTRSGTKQGDVAVSANDATAAIGALGADGSFGTGNTFVLEVDNGQYTLKIDANGDGKYTAADDITVVVVGDTGSTYGYSSTTGDFTFISA